MSGSIRLFLYGVKRTLPVLMVCLCLLNLFVPQPIAAQTSKDGKVNIAQLMQMADKNFDLEVEDAIILYDNEEQTWLPDKRFYTKVHRVVWIGRSWAIRRFADHRIPFDKSRQSFTVNTLRTWRDGQWWESDTTAIVETLPGALQTAYDYTTMREMMLLHDGVELPCILEWEYIIEDMESFRKGVDGMWIFEKDVPVISSSFSFGIPAGSKPSVFISDEVVELPVKTKVSPPKSSSTKSKTKRAKGNIRTVNELDIYSYEMELIQPLPTPQSTDPAAYAPYIAWSTWKNWDKLGQDFRKTFEKAMELDGVLQDSLDLLIEGAFSMNDRAKRIASFVERSTRYINYPSSYWLTVPREAHRSYSTAYCHQLDRAVLAAALFNGAGFEIFPTFRGLDYHDVNTGVATFERFGEVGVWVSGSEEVEALYNPLNSELLNGLSPIYGRSVWIPGSGDDPKVTWRGEANRSTVELNLNLTCNDGSNELIGQGFYRATQGLCPFDKMEGLGGEAAEFLESVLTGVIENAKISVFSPTSLSRFTVTIGFEFTASFNVNSGLVWGESSNSDLENDSGRFILNIGDPAGGVFDHLPGDISIFKETRESDVRIPGLMEQIVNITLSYGDKELSYMPGEIEIKNDIGSFKLVTEETEDQVRISRTLTLDKVDCPSNMWVDLRSILLSDRNVRNRVLVLK